MPFYLMLSSSLICLVHFQKSFFFYPRTLVPLVSHHADFFSKKPFRPFSACRRFLPVPMGSVLESSLVHILWAIFLEWGMAADVCPTAGWVKREGFPCTLSLMVGFSAVSPPHVIVSWFISELEKGVKNGESSASIRAFLS